VAKPKRLNAQSYVSEVWRLPQRFKICWLSGSEAAPLLPLSVSQFEYPPRRQICAAPCVSLWADALLTLLSRVTEQTWRQAQNRKWELTWRILTPPSNGHVNKAVIDRRFRPRCCHLRSYFKRPKSIPVRPLACNWYFCAQFTAKPKAACALRFSWAAMSSNLVLWRHPWNRKYTTYHYAARGGSNHGHR